jgi:hypothetical protein
MAPYPNLEIFMTQFDEDSARREYQRDPALQAEFCDESTFVAYQRGLSAGRIIPPVVGHVVTAAPEPRREADEQVSPPVQRFTSSAAPKRQRKAVDSRDAAKRQEVENRSAALPGPRVTQRATVPDLRGIWQAHGPQAGRVQCSALMQRFGSFEEFQAHVNSHAPEATTNVR